MYHAYALLIENHRSSNDLSPVLSTYFTLNQLCLFSHPNIFPLFNNVCLIKTSTCVLRLNQYGFSHLFLNVCNFLEVKYTYRVYMKTSSVVLEE